MAKRRHDIEKLARLTEEIALAERSRLEQLGRELMANAQRQKEIYLLTQHPASRHPRLADACLASLDACRREMRALQMRRSRQEEVCRQALARKSALALLAERERAEQDRQDAARELEELVGNAAAMPRSQKVSTS